MAKHKKIDCTDSLRLPLFFRGYLAALAVIVLPASPAPSQGTFVMPIPGNVPPGMEEMLKGLAVHTDALESIIALQTQLMEFSQADPENTKLTRPAVSQCIKLLHPYWCRALAGTFQ